MTSRIKFEQHAAMPKTIFLVISLMLVSASSKSLLNIDGPLHRRAIEDKSPLKVTKFVSCMKNKTFQVTMPNQCSYDQLYLALANTLSRSSSNCNANQTALELQTLLNARNTEEAKQTVEEMCEKAITEGINRKDDYNFTNFSGMDNLFNKAFFDGGSSWNDGGKRSDQIRQNSEDNFASIKFRGNSHRMRLLRENVASNRPMTWPENLENFANCSLNAAMCCWTEHDESQGLHYKKNTNLCYVDFSRAPSSSHVKSGITTFNGDENVFCHGFAWENGGANDMFKGNMLFLFEIYENMHNRGLSKNVPGAPMCGCVEQMPVVTHADCSTLKWNGKFVFKYSSIASNSLIQVIGAVTPSTVDCDGEGGSSNSLQQYYNKLYVEGKIDANSKATFDKTIVGDGNCNTSIAKISKVHYAKSIKLLFYNYHNASSFHNFELRFYSNGLKVALGNLSSVNESIANFASNAIDRIASQNASAWWTVDLGETYPIESVTIVNLFCGENSSSINDTGSCYCNLSNSTLFLLNHRGKAFAVKRVENSCGLPELNVHYDDWILT